MSGAFVRSSYPKSSKVKVSVRLDACFPLKLSTREERCCDFHGECAQCLADTPQRHLRDEVGVYVKLQYLICAVHQEGAHVKLQ